MMKKEIEFFKFQGAGNDFIILDNFSGQYDDLTVEQIQFLSNRKFGIGADGLMSINKCDAADFEVVYYNADGSTSFCGNGARCSVAFVSQFLLENQKTFTFKAIDGLHYGEMYGDQVKIDMLNVNAIHELNNDCLEIFTGSPHYIKFDQDIQEKPLVVWGRKVRYNKRYAEKGINANLVEVLAENHLSIRTYERGVEDETLACGTGVTAAAIAYHHRMKKDQPILVVDVDAQGGKLKVEMNFDRKTGYHHLFLIGPAEYVFKGQAYVE